ncbi:hypothetical protein MRX96_052175, partial [Rhipicephalus microplus]
MLSNPLCLAIQVLAILLGESPAVCTVFPGLARDDDVTSSGWPGEAWLSSPVDDRCCIEETTPLLILASTWDQRRVTSVPVIASEPLNPRAVSYHGSGLVSSSEGNMLSNPLCLAIQVLAILLGESPAVCTVFPGLARDDDVTSSGWPGEAWLSSPVDDRCCIEETTPLLILASTWDQRRVTSVPVIASEPLNPRAVSYHGSGLVSSSEGNMLSNPLCLAIQVLAILLGESPAVCTVFPGLARDDDVTSSGWPGEAWLSSPVDDRCCIEETTPLLILASTWDQRRVTSVPVIASEPLNPRAVSYHGSGLVSSSEGNMLSNPLCLAIQVLAILLGESPAVCTVFPGLARDDDVTSSGWPGEAWLSSPVDDRCCIEETTPLLILASTWDQRRVTSVPVIASEPLNPRAVSYHG